jgi:hypothetical protein
MKKADTGVGLFDWRQSALAQNYFAGSGAGLDASERK